MEEDSTQSINDKEPGERTAEDHNQVTVQMESGKEHNVEYVLRHPNRNWVYANKVTNVNENGEIKSRDLILREEKIESINSLQVSTETADLDVDNYSVQATWIHHSVPYEYVSVDNAWKAWPSDDELQADTTQRS